MQSMISKPSMNRGNGGGPMNDPGIHFSMTREVIFEREY